MNDQGENHLENFCCLDKEKHCYDKKYSAWDQSQLKVCNSMKCLLSIILKELYYNLSNLHSFFRDSYEWEDGHKDLLNQ